ncbi:MAG: histidine kinase [Sulfurovum sp.]|nr:histidine kinase [Sulfurovum sp.]
MHDIALRIKVTDWLYILLIGIFFAALLSMLGYILLGYSWVSGVQYGAVLGFMIALFSLVSVSFMNQIILPKMHQRYWLSMAMVFSFFSGFFGTLSGTLTAKKMSIEIVPPLDTNLVNIAAAIGMLTYIVGALLYRFVKMRNEKEAIDHCYVQSRLRSLETQLNPHFLFNALNSVAELIHYDPFKAEEALLRVSAFLRNTMKEEALVFLEEELQNVQDYIALENIRFSGRIHWTQQENIPPLRLPKFSIQLLVENAVKHGMKAQQSLHISLCFNEEKKQLMVKNDGEPMSSASFGIGLNNLNQRLALLCKGHLEVAQMNPPIFSIHLGECYENTHRR